VIDMVFFGVTLGWGSRRSAPDTGTPPPLEDPEAPLEPPDMTAAR
jgi:hypothetical protein